jgi:hypothetical protein
MTAETDTSNQPHSSNRDLSNLPHSSNRDSSNLPQARLSEEQKISAKKTEKAAQAEAAILPQSHRRQLQYLLLTGERRGPGLPDLTWSKQTKTGKIYQITTYSAKRP